MSVGWIDVVFNNAKSNWYLKSVDTEHNGALSGGGSNFRLDDGKFHLLKPGTRYQAEWCGIPWYASGKHCKVFSKSSRNGVALYASELEGKNWIVYTDFNTGRPIARQSAPKGSDFHCYMRFEDEGVFVDIVNNNEFSGENAVYAVFDEARGWMKELGPIIAAAISRRGNAGR